MSHPKRGFGVRRASTSDWALGGHPRRFSSPPGVYWAGSAAGWASWGVLGAGRWARVGGGGGGVRSLGQGREHHQGNAEGLRVPTRRVDALPGPPVASNKAFFSLLTIFSCHNVDDYLLEQRFRREAGGSFGRYALELDAVGGSPEDSTGFAGFIASRQLAGELVN